MTTGSVIARGLAPEYSDCSAFVAQENREGWSTAPDPVKAFRKSPQVKDQAPLPMGPALEISFAATQTATPSRIVTLAYLLK